MICLQLHWQSDLPRPASSESKSRGHMAPAIVNYNLITLIWFSIEIFKMLYLLKLPALDMIFAKMACTCTVNKHAKEHKWSRSCQIRIDSDSHRIPPRRSLAHAGAMRGFGASRPPKPPVRVSSPGSSPAPLGVIDPKDPTKE